MSTNTIHPTAIIGPKTELGENVHVGPYTIIEGEAFIDSGTQIGAHVYIDRYTHIGKNCLISPFASIGTPPQDIKFKGEKTQVVIGDENVHPRICHYQPRNFRRRGFNPIGNQNLIMAYCHVGHDCQVGNGIVMANVATLAGHVVLEDYSRLGGLVGCPAICSGGGLCLGRRKNRGSKGYSPLCHSLWG